METGGRELVEERAVGWTEPFFIQSQRELERARGWLCFLNESPKSGFIDVIDVEFTILPGQ